MVDQPEIALQGAVHQTRMEDIISQRVLYDARQPQVSQKLVAPPMNSGYSLKGRPIHTTRPDKRRVYTAGLYLALPHLLLELIEIELGRRRPATPDSPTLAMDNLLSIVPAVNPVVDLVVAVRRQRDADLPLLVNDDWLRPDGVAQLQHRRFGPRRRCALDRSPRHFQTRDARQDLLQRATIHAYQMICQEEFVARESRAIALLAQIGRVAM